MNDKLAVPPTVMVLSKLRPTQQIVLILEIFPAENTKSSQPIT